MSFHSIRVQLFLLALGINLFTSAIYMVYSYQRQVAAYHAGLADSLKNASMAIRDLVGGDDFFQSASRGEVTPRQHERNVRALSRYATDTGIDYLYAFGTNATNAVVFIATNATDQQLDEHAWFPFGMIYESPSSDLLNQFVNLNRVMGEYQDNYGTFYSVTVPIQAHGQTFILGADRKIEDVRRHLSSFFRTALAIGSIVFVFFLLITYSIINYITQPIARLAAYTRGLAGRDFAEPSQSTELESIRDRSSEEISDLARAFAEMERSLVRYLSDLKATTAAKERFESEVQIAKNIQMGILPRTFSPFPEAPGLDLFASVRPARQVGGDLYDFFFLDDHRIGFAVGDVSDKGIPAAIFMAATKTLLKTLAVCNPQTSAGRILELLNRELSNDNATGQFVTLFFGILDTRTGEVSFSDAGHNPPVLLPAPGEPPADFIDKGESGLAIGIFDDVPYRTQSFKLKPGQGLLLYTDGVTEAQNGKSEFYGDPRLLEVARAVPNAEARPLHDRLFQDIDAFAGEADQADDITVLVLRWNLDLGKRRK